MGGVTCVLVSSTSTESDGSDTIIRGSPTSTLVVLKALPLDIETQDVIGQFMDKQNF